MFLCVAALLSLSCDAALHDTSFEPERFEGRFDFSMLYATKPCVGLTGNLACTRCGGLGSVWEEIKERIVPFFRGSVNQKNNAGSVAVVVTDSRSICFFFQGK